jgi:hypothetical protein
MPTTRFAPLGDVAIQDRRTLRAAWTVLSLRSSP